MKIAFRSLVKTFQSKALVSGDKGYSVTLQGEDSSMTDLANAPADQEVLVTIEYGNNNE